MLLIPTEQRARVYEALNMTFYLLVIEDTTFPRLSLVTSPVDIERDLHVK